MMIREAKQEDWPDIWPIFQQIVTQGDTYGFDPETTLEQGKKIWIDAPAKTFVVEDNQQILATYYLKTNQAGPGNHVCNCGYMVSAEQRGKGLAKMMCEHSQIVARELGYKAMQFNFVAASNKGAVRLWQNLGFETVGCLPLAFNHPAQGYVDALVMFKAL